MLFYTLTGVVLQLPAEFSNLIQVQNVSSRILEISEIGRHLAPGAVCLIEPSDRVGMAAVSSGLAIIIPFSEGDYLSDIRPVLKRKLNAYVPFVGSGIGHSSPGCCPVV